MATEAERKAKREEVEQALAELSVVDPEKLARRTELTPSINFGDAVPAFEEMLELTRQLKERDLSRLSLSHLNDIYSGCREIQTRIAEVKSFDIAVQQNAGNACKDIITRVKSSYDSIINHMVLPLAFTATQATDFAKIEREAKGFHATMSSEATRMKEDLDRIKVEAALALSAVKGIAAEAGVTTNAQTFMTESEAHAKSAKNWIIGTICMTIVTFLAAVGMYIESFYYHPQGIETIIQHVVGKLIVLSVLSYGVYWCARNHRAHKHNETLNKHRANALKTFRAFVEGSADERVKDAILLQASQATFVNRPTGYDSTEAEQQCISPVIDILGKSLSKVSGPHS